jgi:hypothetical protein
MLIRRSWPTCRLRRSARQRSECNRTAIPAVVSATAGPSNSRHQHFSDDKNDEPIVLVMKAKPLFLFMHMIFQKVYSKGRGISA